eukprot:TRINITY_DN17468_c0_g1_i1.p1 TRINITY_DN17468_c0_g1~~TRINITY_DN17468_c0_g1_i1.p1  ORF type:complete len:421 (+),score=77.76 TRINITY_DN17468_c0_g1_i1:314-1576(+)
MYCSLSITQYVKQQLLPGYLGIVKKILVNIFFNIVSIFPQIFVNSCGLKKFGQKVDPKNSPPKTQTVKNLQNIKTNKNFLAKMTTEYDTQNTYYQPQPPQNTAKVFTERKARKTTEEDVLKLYNRIRQLQKEEEKADKNIEETKSKALEILQLRERNEQKEIEKQERVRELRTEIERQKEDIQKNKIESRKVRLHNETKVYNEKLILAQQTKEERLEIERMVAETKLVSRRRALEQKQNVRKSQQDAIQKTLSLKSQKLQIAHEDYERRLKEEIQLKQQKEKELFKLMKIEQELIERLKEKRQEQFDAFQELEQALQRTGKNYGISANLIKSHGGKFSQDYQQQQQQQQNGEPSEEEIARTFATYDVEGNGFVRTVQLESLMRDLGLVLRPEQVNMAILQLDRKQQGQVSFGEFLLWWRG